LPMLTATKNEDAKKIQKLLQRHAKAFQANRTEVQLATDQISEEFPDFTKSVQLSFNNQWSIQNTAQIPQENIEKIKSIRVEVETFSYLESILKKVETLTELEEIKVVSKSDFMRNIWSSFDLTKFTKLRSV